MNPWTDEQILDGMQDPARRGEAFRALHLRYGPRLLGVLARICRGDRDRAEDLLGRALYKAYQGLARLDRPCRSLPAWLYTVATRTALDELERERRDEGFGVAPLNEELVSDRHLPLEEREAVSKRDAAVEAVLERLGREQPRYRTLLEMEHVGACSRDEIAEATGIERRQLSQYLKRARERFIQLAREEPALADRAPAGTGGGK